MPIKKILYGRKKRTNKKTYKKKTVKKAITTAKRKNFSKSVMRVVKRNTETKFAEPLLTSKMEIQAPVYNQGVLAYFPGTCIELTSIFSLIKQGPGQGDRIGNVISPTSFTFKGFLTYSQAGFPEIPYIVKMVICRMKNTLTATTMDMSKFFQFGNATSYPTNSLTDIRQKINSNDIVVYATRVFKISQASGGVEGSASNDYKLTSFFNINLTKYVRKVVYDDETLLCKNHQIFAVFLVAPCDGSNLYTGEAQPYNMTNLTMGYDIQCSYKDD